MKLATSGDVRAGFGLGLGLSLARVALTLLAVALFVPGLVLLARERRRATRDRATVVAAYTLMAAGAVLGLGMGADILFAMILDAEWD